MVTPAFAANTENNSFTFPAGTIFHKASVAESANHLAGTGSSFIRLF